MAEADAIFFALFSVEPEAAMLALDDVGLLPEELLYIPKAVFFMGVASQEQGLIRYNMRERFRQEMFRKVFAVKKELLARGKPKVMERWENRDYVFPDAPVMPDLTKVKRKEGAAAAPQQSQLPDGSVRINGKTLGVLEEDLDTESEDDGLDEFFKPKPKPQPKVASPTPPPRISSRDGRPTSRGKQPETPQVPKVPIPQPPRDPPRCKALTTKQLEKEEFYLEVSRKRLAKYGKKVDVAAALTVERQEQRRLMKERPNSQGRLPQFTPTQQRTPQSARLATPSSSGMELTAVKSPPTESRAPMLPTILPKMTEVDTKRQLQALLRTTMVEVARTAIEYNQFRDELSIQEQDQKERSLPRSSRTRNHSSTGSSGGSQGDVQARDIWAAQAEARARRAAEQRQQELMIADAYDDFTKQKQERTEKVLKEKKFKHQLSSEVIRMRQIFASEKRECLARAEEGRIAKTLARSDPKQMYALMVSEQKQMAAQQLRMQHIQMELLRKELKRSVDKMNVKNEWEVPKVIEQLTAQPEDGAVLSVEGPPENPPVTPPLMR